MTSPMLTEQVPGRAKPRWKSLFNFYSRRHAPIFITALLLATAAGITGPALAIFFGKIFDAFSAFGSGAVDGNLLMHKVSVDAIALCILGATVWFLKGGYFALWMVFGELQAKNTRDQLFQSLLEKDFEWYEMRTSGIQALLPRLQTQIRELQIGTSQPLGFSIQYVVQAFASLGLAFYKSWNLTLVILAGLPISAVIMFFISSMMQPSIIRQELALSRAAKLTNSAVSAIETVKCFNGQTSELAQYKTAALEAARHYIKQALSNSLQIGFVRFVTTAMFVQGFWYGGHLVTAGKSSAGDVLTTFWACLMATKAVEDILPHMIVLEKGRAAGAAMKAILDSMGRGLKVDSKKGQYAPTFCEGDVEMRDISFAYPSRPDNLVLKELTLFFPAGETTFVVGKSGSGKSTLGGLLMRFYEPTAGSMLLDGTPINELDVNWLRNNISLVQQESILFNESIFRNIALGRRDYLRINEEQVRTCIAFAALDSFINEMPRGLDTVVGSGGNALSGGQRQRIAVARARLRDTPILILDEPTSSLDSVSRRAVMEAIRDWRRGKTTLIITHDISQIREDDFVYVLENGRIIEEGYRRALTSLQKRSLKPSASTMIATPGYPIYGLSERQVQAQMKVTPYSNLNSGTRQSSMRKDSVDMYLDGIPESPIRIQTASTDIDGSIELPVAQKRSSAGRILDVFSHRPAVQDGQRSSFYFIVPHEDGMQQLPLAKSKTLGIHRALSHGARPMSMHQAMTVNNVYHDAMLPTDHHKFNMSTPMQKPPPELAGDSVVLSDVHKPLEPKIEEKRRSQHIASIRFILQTVWPTLSVRKRAQLVLGFVLALVHAAGPPTFSYVFSELLGTFFIREKQAQKALVYSMAILGIAIIDAISDGGMHYLLEGCGQAWVDALRIRAFERILDQPKAWFDEDENSLASLTSSLDRNAEEMRNLVGRFAPFIVVVAAMMTIATVWSLVVCWKLTLVGIAAAPSLYLATKGFEAVSSKWENLTNSAGNEAGSVFAETFMDLRTVRALTLESYFHKKYNKATSKALVVGVKRAAFSGFFFGASDSAINFVTALVFWYGAKVAAEGDFSVKSILTVFSLLLFSTANANAVIAYIPQISSSVDTATRLLRLSNLPLHRSHEHGGKVKLDSSYDPTAIASSSPAISFVDLTFAYPSRGPSAPALSKLNLTIPSGISTALVGASGSGKSTIASLVLNLYPATTSDGKDRSSSRPSPSLSIFGHDIRTLDTASLRNLIAVVSQNPILFPTTVRANITYGLDRSPSHPPSPSTTPSSSHPLYSAARQAGIHDFILSLPSGYDTLIGDGGLGLSGGQAQRIVIARALFRRPRILILDEATSALDAESADVVRKTIVDLVSRKRKKKKKKREGGERREREMVIPASSSSSPPSFTPTSTAGGAAAGSTDASGSGRGGCSSNDDRDERMTVLMITHSKEMMQCADNVVVLEKGRVVEEGTYADLVSTEGGTLWKMLRDDGG